MILYHERIIVNMRRHPCGMAKSSRLGAKELVIRERKVLKFRWCQFGGTPPPLLFLTSSKYFSNSSFSKKPLIILERHSLLTGCRYSKIVTFLKYACIHSTLRITSFIFIHLVQCVLTTLFILQSSFVSR